MGSIQFPVTELRAADLISQIIVKMPAPAQNLFSFSGNVKVRYRLSVFIDDKALLIRLKGIRTFFY